MPALVQRLYPALRPGAHLTLEPSGTRLFSRQGDWDSGSALHCVAMALAMLGELSDPVDVRGYGHGPIAHFWDRAWPYYLHGLTLSELACFAWELNMGVQPIKAHGNTDELMGFCEQELTHGWPVIVMLFDCRSNARHATLVTGIEERDGKPETLLLLDPAEAEPVLSACNARLERGSPHTAYITAQSASRIRIDGAVSIRLPNGNATEGGCA